FRDCDLVLQKAGPTYGTRMAAKALAARAECWRPWRAYAVIHVWKGSMAAQKAMPSVGAT
ncbi:MAG: DNA-3-methyladenine glycosylase 2 family protein, partial [Pseudoxanthomonas sp.]|nr:DNA-3-methyladenine glycosylase 2 family protein [Pseudoxanthomonas sp.]